MAGEDLVEVTHANLTEASQLSVRGRAACDAKDAPEATLFKCIETVAREMKYLMTAVRSELTTSASLQDYAKDAQTQAGARISAALSERWSRSDFSRLTWDPM